MFFIFAVFKSLFVSMKKVIANLLLLKLYFLMLNYFGIILYFYHEYIKNEFEETIENKNEKAKYYINNALLNYNSFFQDVKLTKERVQELINISKTFDQFFVSLN
jgi:hypothetical protein